MYAKILAVLVLILIANQGLADCYILGGGCENCAVQREDLMYGENLTFPGSSLPSGSAVVREGNDLKYNGSASDFSVVGPYFSKPGSRIQITPFIEISTNWSPDTYRTCNKRNWLNKCVGWTTHNYESGFTVDYTVKTNNQILWSRTYKNILNENHTSIGLPTLICEEALDRFEVRLNQFYGGSVEFTLHSLRMHVQWND